MILLSLSKSDGYLTYVLYAEGVVQKRETIKSKCTKQIESGKEFAEHMAKGLKASFGYLEDNVEKLPADTVLNIEVSNGKPIDWLIGGDIAPHYYSSVAPCITQFSKLPFEAVMEHKNKRDLRATKYNSSEYVTESGLKVMRLVDIW